MSWIEVPQRSSPLPYRGVLSFRSEAREASDSETARLHHAARWRGSVAARGARAATRADTAHRGAHATTGRRSGIAGSRYGVRAGAAAIWLDRWPQRAD